MRYLEKSASLAVLTCVYMASCTGDSAPGKHGPGELDHSKLRPTRLEGRVLASGEYLSLPTELALVNGQLLVVDGSSDSVLHVIDARDGRHVRSQGRRGEGPGEYAGAWSVAREARTPGRPWVYDLQLARLTRVDLSAASGSPSEAEIIRVQGEALATQPVWVHDSLLVSPSFSPRGRLSFFGADGAFRRAAGPLPKGNGGVPPSVLQQAWTGTLVANPRTGSLALVTRHADQVEIYGPDGTPVQTVRGPFRFDPQFTAEQVQGQPVMASSDAMRFGYIDAEATGEAIYALFSGRTRERFNQAASFGRYVHVYDWSGGLAHVYRLDSDILAITLAPDGKRLYGIRHDPEPSIISYALEE